MNIFSWLKHLLRAKRYTKLKKYDLALKSYTRAVCIDKEPSKKIIPYDNEIAFLADKIIKDKNFDILAMQNAEYNRNNVLILNTEIYDTGGHTECAIRYVEKSKENVYFYCVLFNTKSMQTAPVKSEKIKSLVKDYTESDLSCGYANRVINVLNYIRKNKIGIIYSNIHMYDAIGCAVLAIVKKYCKDIKIIFWNHGDHFFALGTSFADEIYTRVKNGKALSEYLKDNKNCKYGKFIVNYDPSKNISEIEKSELKEKLGIPQDAFVTMTGCVIDKIGKEYGQMIDKILKKNTNIYHLFICPSYPQKEKKLMKIFKNNPRVILHPGTPEFDKYIQITDLYVDSFPQGSALTLVDFIKYSKPVVIKINKKEPIKSFEEYLYPNYEFAYETPKGMIEGVTELANNQDLYKKLQVKVHEHFEKTYLG